MDNSIFHLFDQHIDSGLNIHSAMLVVSQDSNSDLDPCTPPERSEINIPEKADVTIFEYPKKTVFYIKATNKPRKILSVFDFNHVLGYIEAAGHNLTGAHIKRIGININDKIGCNFWIKGKMPEMV